MAATREAQSRNKNKHTSAAQILEGQLDRWQAANGHIHIFSTLLAQLAPSLGRGSHLTLSLSKRFCLSEEVGKSGDAIFGFDDSLVSNLGNMENSS